MGCVCDFRRVRVQHNLGVVFKSVSTLVMSFLLVVVFDRNRMRRLDSSCCQARV